MIAIDLPVIRLHARALRSFDQIVRQVTQEQWAHSTPCSAWDVRTLVNHVVGEARWTPPLLAGMTIAEVGTSLDGDLLGDDPLAAWDHALALATDAARGPEIGEQTVQLSFGEVPAQEYLRQLTADYLIHAWDLASAIGADERLDAELVACVGGWFVSKEAGYRAAGAIGEAPGVEHDGDPQVRLLAMFGRASGPGATLAAVNRFGEAFDRRDVEAVLAAMTVDCVFESTAPPDGVRYEGQAAVREAWTEFFESTAGAAFRTEEQFVCGDRVIARWRYSWSPEEADHVRGVDVFRVRDGLVAEKLSYVKG
jgi:uncharacterized protein (TIGR03086 family)